MNFKDVLAAARGCPEWTSRYKKAIATTDLDAECKAVDKDSKGNLARIELDRGTMLQLDGWTGPGASLNFSSGGYSCTTTVEQTGTQTRYQCIFILSSFSKSCIVPCIEIVSVDIQ